MPVPIRQSMRRSDRHIRQQSRQFGGNFPRESPGQKFPKLPANLAILAATSLLDRRSLHLLVTAYDTGSAACCVTGRERMG
jgi:hypothetical protein